MGYTFQKENFSFMLRQRERDREFPILSPSDRFCQNNIYDEKNFANLNNNRINRRQRCVKLVEQNAIGKRSLQFFTRLSSSEAASP